jgi:monoamine oxidase
MGHVSKMALRFRERFWSTHGRFGFALDDSAAFPTWWTQDPSVSHWLTGWAGGSPSQKLIGLPKQELVERAVSSLAKIFSISGKTLHELVDGVEHHDWSCDPYSRGAYSYQGVGGLEASRALAQQVDDTLWFAGEATDSFGHSGTVHAALASGLRAASEIIALT